MSFPPKLDQGARTPNVFQSINEESPKLPKPVDPLEGMSASQIISGLSPAHSSEELGDDLCEYIAWLERFTSNACEFKKICEEVSESLYPWVKQSACSSVSTIMSHLRIPVSRTTLESKILSISEALLMRTISSDKQKIPTKVKILAVSHEFLSSLLAFAWEMYLLSVDSTLISFDALIRAFSVSPVDFWKQIIHFKTFNTDNSKLLARHIDILEEKILFQMIWKEKSFHRKIFIDTCKVNKTDSILLKVHQILSKRVCILADFFKFGKMAKNAFWKAIKYFIVAHSDTLNGRSLDYVLFCTLLGLVKLNSHVHINSLVYVYCDLIFTDKMQDVFGDLEDLIHYYNEIYIYHMKNFIVQCKALKSWKIPVYFSRFVTNKMLGKLPCSQLMYKKISNRQEVLINASSSQIHPRKQSITFNFENY